MTSATSKYEILVVDDSPVHRKLIEHILSDYHDYSLSFACSGIEALQMYHEKAISIVITDWVMPDFSGLELCEHIRQAPA